MDNDNLIRPPFQRTHLKSANPLESGKVITVRLNVVEYKQLQDLQKALNLTTESSALKVAAMVGRNVLHATLGPEFLGWLSDPSRRTREAT